MKIIPYGTKNEDILYLNLVSKDDGVELVVVDKNNEPVHEGKILTIRNNGTLRRFSALSSSLGLQLQDSDGRIKIVE